ncbi:MAG: rhodanese-like domain-containing protein [Elusimicrobiota bacterium]
MGSGICGADAGHRVLIALAFAALGSSLAFAEQAPEVTAQELLAMRKGEKPVMVIDVRPAKDYMRVHIEGAVNHPHDAIHSVPLPKDRVLALYCSGVGCPLSAKAAKDLLKRGYEDVRVLKEGFMGWQAAGLPTSFKFWEHPTTPGEGLSARHVGCSDLKSALEHEERPVVIDLRPAQEFSAGHLPRARNIPLKEFSAYAVGKDTDTPVLVYHRSPDKARTAAKTLVESGFGDVTVLGEDLGVWIQKGYSWTVR